MNDKLHSLLSLLGPVLLALFVAAKLNHASLAGKGKSEHIAKVLELIASVLLPLVVLSVVRRTEISTSLWIPFVIGFLLPIFVYVVVLAVARLPMVAGVFSTEGRVNHLLLSSFGGGNRGNLLVLTAFGTQSSIAPDVIKQFVVLDLGNLMCLLTLGFLMVGRVCKKKNELKLSDILETLLKNPGTYAAILIFLQLPAFRDTDLARAVTTFDPLLKATGPFLNPLFSFCIFLAIFIRIERLSGVLVDTSGVISSFVISRATAAVGILTLLAVLDLPTELLIATAILALMPPSSFLWTRISQISPIIPAASKRKAIYLVPNFFFFAMLAGAFIWGLL